MKFCIALVVLAVAVCANASVIPLAYASAWGHPLGPSLTVSSHHGWAAAPHHAPAAITAYASPAHWDHAPIAHASWTAPAAAHHWAAPAAHWAAAPAAHWAAPAAHHSAVVAAHAPAHHHEGQYVAANRGSVHTAPLPGHATSATSLNLQPAPGTW